MRLPIFPTTLILGACVAIGTGAALAQQSPLGLALPNTAKVADVFTPLPAGAVKLTGGFLASRYDASAAHRLLALPEVELLDAFEHRDQPHQDWQGEHAGKFLHAATLTWATTGSKPLKAKIDRVARRLMATQEADGYLGTYPPAQRWTSWDVWCHKYDMLGLLTYYQYTHNKAALAACRKVGNLLVNTFGPGKRDINKAGFHMGMAATSVMEPMVLLYRATGDARYLNFARYIIRNYDAPGGPSILSTLDKGAGVNKIANGKAYEMLSNFNGLLEEYRVSGDSRIKRDLLRAWEDVSSKRLYITGSASSAELFQPDYHLPNGESFHICETCVTVTWEQSNLQLLRLTGTARYADAAERTIYNHLLGAQSPDGSEWSYYTPLEGRKPYSPVITCCASSGPRGIALIPSVAVMQSADGGLVVNLFNPLTARARLKTGPVTLRISGNYPVAGRVVINVTPAASRQAFPLRVRIPAWAAGAKMTVDGKPVAAKPGTYATIRRTWSRASRIVLTLPVSPRLVLGDHENAGKAAVVCGPMVMALDAGLSPRIRMLKQIALDVAPDNRLQVAKATGGSPEELLVKTTVHVAADPKPIQVSLRPYAAVGANATRTIVWMALPGHQTLSSGTGSLFFAGRVSASRRGNAEGDLADDDFTSYSVTWDDTKAPEDWYAVNVDSPVTVGRVLYAHGRNFNNGGWWDTSRGKPRIEIQEKPNGPWTEVATLDSYPQTNAETAPALKDGETFEVRFAPVQCVGIRIIGVPSCGDGPKQAFSSCAELQGFAS